MNNKEIAEVLKKDVDPNIKLPSGITFASAGDSVTITLSEKAIGLGKEALNMQTDAAAFEGWAIALYVHFLKLKGKILLNAVISESYKNQFNGGHCHYNRFLFRVMKFSEQFGDWFQVGKDIAEAVDMFKLFLAPDSFSFVNNIAEGETGDNGNLENYVEGLLADQMPEMLRTIVKEQGVSLRNPIYRQLPTGLFKGEKSEKTRIFTGGKSAIDLWTEQDKTIFIFELKARSKMVGIITELFFYANYMYDMFCDPATSFVPSFPKDSKDHRGYKDLLDSDGKKNHDQIQAFFLSDQSHPLLTPEVVGLLNNGAKGITYRWLDYPMDIVIGKTTGTPTK